jgi:hypothetical protein
LVICCAHNFTVQGDTQAGIPYLPGIWCRCSRGVVFNRELGTALDLDQVRGADQLGGEAETQRLFLANGTRNGSPSGRFDTLTRRAASRTSWSLT